MNYWLLKSEPDAYSIADLAAEKTGRGRWDGVRNYQARNLLRDAIKQGDEFFFYHSSCKLTGIVGTGIVVSDSYPDPSQFRDDQPGFDPKATQEQPRWYCVDVAHKKTFANVLSLKQLKQESPLAEMALIRQGRLSVQPVSADEWQYINSLAERQ